MGWGEPSQRTGKARLGKLECLSLQPGNRWRSCSGRGREEAREGLWEGGGGRRGRRVPAEKVLALPLIFSLLSLLPADNPDLLWAPAPRLQPVQNQAGFFFPSRNWLWCVARPLPSSSQLLPSFFFSSFFFLRHGPGSGSWKRNKCGKRERKSELNDRMQAT